MKQAEFSLWICEERGDDFRQVVAAAPRNSFMVCGHVQNMVLQTPRC